MVVTIGVNSYTYSEELTEDIEIIEVPEDPNNPVIPDDSEVPVDPVDPEEPVEPVDPVDPEVPVDSGDPETPTEPQFLEYTVIYFVDDIEEIEWQITGQVSIENPIVEEIPYDNLPEGYIIDEERSTQLPLEVNEENNVIEVYYVLNPMMRSIGLMAIVSGGLEYPSSTDPLLLKMKSTNDHSQVIFAWIHGSDIYLAIISQKSVVEVTYNGVTIKANNDNYERAPGRNDYLKVANNHLGKIDEYKDRFNTLNNNHRWSVLKISGQQLVAEFTISIDTDSGGHNIGDVGVKINSELQVYHVYEGIEDFDFGQSGFLENDFSYSVRPIYTYNNEEYELFNIKILHNGIEQGDKGPDDLIDDYLNGSVDGSLDGASAKITFIYIKLADGELTIRKEIIDSQTFDPNQEFDIFINGPKGKQYVVTLKAGSSKTLTGLEYGEYEIYEIVPMNYKPGRIESNGEVNIDKNNKQKSVEVTNSRTNDGYFYDDDERKNNFSVGVTPVSTSRKQSIELEQDVILPKEEFLQEEILLEEDYN